MKKGLMAVAYGKAFGLVGINSAFVSFRGGTASESSFGTMFGVRIILI